jgi:hypothetical protein
MKRAFCLLFGILLFVKPAFALETFPATFKTQTVKTNGT